MSRIPSFLLQHTVTVEPYEGNSANGPVYGAPVTVRCWLEDGNQLVRDPEGNEVVSDARFFARLDAVDAPPESRVTLPTGRRCSVITVLRHDGGDLPTPDHLEVALKTGR